MCQKRKASRDGARPASIITAIEIHCDECYFSTFTAQGLGIRTTVLHPATGGKVEGSRASRHAHRTEREWCALAPSVGSVMLGRRGRYVPIYTSSIPMTPQGTTSSTKAEWYMTVVSNWHRLATLMLCACAFAGCGKKPEPARVESDPKPAPPNPGPPDPAAPNPGPKVIPKGVGVFASSPTRIARSRRGDKLAMHEEGVIKVWDVSPAADGVAMEQPHRSEHLAISPDGGLVASYSSAAKELRVWDAKTGKSKFAKKWEGNGDIGFSSDGQFVVCTLVNKNAVVLDASTGTETRLVPPEGLFPTVAACSPQKNVVAVSSGAVGGKKSAPTPPSVDLYNTDGSHVDVLHPGQFVYSLAFSDAGDLLACRSPSKLLVFKVDGWAQTAAMESKGTGLGKLHVGPGAKFVAALEGGRVTVWDVAAGMSRQFDAKDCVDIAFHPKGGLLVARKGGTLAVYDPATGEAKPGL